MNKKMKIASLMILLSIFLVLPINRSHAYLDPGTGSYILQLVVAGIAGALISIKVFWRNIKMFLVSIFYRDKQDGLSEKTDDKN
jgi:hypothetical protein